MSAWFERCAGCAWEQRARDGAQPDAAAALDALPDEKQRRDHQRRGERSEREMRAEREQQFAELAEEERNAGGKIQRHLPCAACAGRNVLPKGKDCVGGFLPLSPQCGERSDREAIRVRGKLGGSNPSPARSTGAPHPDPLPQAGEGDCLLRARRGRWRPTARRAIAAERHDADWRIALATKAAPAAARRNSAASRTGSGTVAAWRSTQWRAMPRQERARRQAGHCSGAKAPAGSASAGFGAPDADRSRPTAPRTRRVASLDIHSSSVRLISEKTARRGCRSLRG